MIKQVTLDIFYRGHNPYFNRWFSAINMKVEIVIYRQESHNPYFNRWFSAIIKELIMKKTTLNVTILILIDGFLQYGKLKS